MAMISVLGNCGLTTGLSRKKLIDRIYKKKVLSVWTVFRLWTIAEVRNSVLALGDVLLIDYIQRNYTKHYYIQGMRRKEATFPLTTPRCNYIVIYLIFMIRFSS